ncbi:MAG: carboxylate-amine ligase [Armatimonadota bacterium]|nr:carboxylate-amine ligase [Armatimonadota bacterium]
MPATSHPFTIGVEEEYQIIDPTTRELKPRSVRLVPQVRLQIGDQVQNELFQAEIEIGTRICPTLADVRAEIIRLRRAVIEVAEKDGDRIAATATHPFSHWAKQPLTPKVRYFNIAKNYQQLTREQIICGCHVHVGLSDREAPIHIMNRARGWLSVLLALSANSPFWLGQDTGYASYRTEIWRRWPMAGSPHMFNSRAEYDELVQALIATGSIADETKIYWDMRPADRFGTVEFRVADVCLTVDEAVMVAGLVRALARTCLEAVQRDLETADHSFVPVRPELLRAAEWRAARYGLDADLIDVHAGRAVVARDMVGKLLSFVRPALEAMGEWDEVSTLVCNTLKRGNGAARQRAVYQRTGRLKDVVDFIVQETGRG